MSIHDRDKNRILFISGSIGLGHAGRDIAIAKALRTLNPAIEISWLAGEPARCMIAEAGETLLPEAHALGNETDLAEEISDGFSLNLSQYAWRARHHWEQNIAAKEATWPPIPTDGARRAAVLINKLLDSWKH